MLNRIEEAIEDIKNGKMVIVVDDEDRENEGDFVMASELVTPEAINFMAKYGRGIICTSITKQRAKELELAYMVDQNNSPHATPFTVTIDLIKGNTTGISAADRSRTIKAMVDSQTRPQDFYRPGHIFPLVARDGGVRERPGHTEASVDLAKLSNLYPSGIICEIMNDDGTMARMPDLIELAKEHDMKLISIKDMIEYIENKTDAKKIDVEEKSEVVEFIRINLPTQHGDFELVQFKSPCTNEQHFAIIKGDPSKSDRPLVRIHSECFTGDVLSSLRCDCGEQLHKAFENIEEEKCGIILYMKQEGRGIGLENKLKAYKLQESGMDTVEANIHLGFDADLRNYDFAANMLQSLGVNKVTLMTNNPSKVTGLEKHGINVERKALEILSNAVNKKYLTAKKMRMGHILDQLYLH